MTVHLLRLKAESGTNWADISIITGARLVCPVIRGVKKYSLLIQKSLNVFRDMRHISAHKHLIPNLRTEKLFPSLKVTLVLTFDF